MDIRNVTQFASFVSSNGLTSLDPTIRQVVICLEDFNRQCNCHRREDKNRIYVNCNNLYIAAAGMAAGRFRDAFLSKTDERHIAFYSDGGALIARAAR